MSKTIYGRRTAAFALFLCLLSAAGCTSEKARQLTLAANQFRSNAHEAIGSVRELMDAELASVPRSETQQADQFAAAIMAQSSSTRINADTMDWALDPKAVKLSPTEAADRGALIADLDQQYSDFAAMFDGLERGSLLAKDSVARTKQYAAKLTAQMAGIAKMTANNPPALIQSRTAVLVQVNKVRKDSSLSDEQRRQALAELRAKWLAVKAQETELQQRVVDRCLQAAAAGQVVLQLADSYNSLSADDINQMITRILSLGQELSGKNLGELQERNDKVIAFLNSNAQYKAAADDVLTRLQSRLGRQEAKK